VLIAFLAWPKREPRYGGRRLSAWVRDAVEHGEGDLEYVRAQEAVRRIGTNALPYLLENIRYETPEWMNTVGRATEKIPGPFESWWSSIIEHRNFGEQASTGFEILGPEAAPAIGGLVSLLDYRDSEDRPAHVLADLGRVAVPSLLVVLTNRTSDVHQRAEAAFTIGLMETNASDLVGVLEGCLDDDPEVAGAAAEALSCVTTNAGFVVGVLTTALKNPSAEFRAKMLDALYRLGERAVRRCPRSWPALLILTRTCASLQRMR
jgi:hypothetical protein